MQQLLQLVKKVKLDFFDCTSAAEHFEKFKMLLCPKALNFKAFGGGLLECEAGLAPSRTPAEPLFQCSGMVF